LDQTLDKWPVGDETAEMTTVPEAFQHQKDFAGLSTAGDLERKWATAYRALDRLILVCSNTFICGHPGPPFLNKTYKLNTMLFLWSWD
jgi:hypothetical protein